MRKSCQNNLMNVTRRFCGGQGGATASEYAAILAVVVIAVIVSALVVGKELRSGVGHMKSSLAMTTPSGGTGARTSEAIVRPSPVGHLGESGTTGAPVADSVQRGRFVTPVLGVQESDEK